MFRSFVLLLGLMSVTELSANPDLSALESGMDAHLPKPLDVHRLQSLIEKVVH